MKDEGRTIGDLTEPRVEQRGPAGRGEFAYVDISSIDREAKRIVDPKILSVAKAPSRAKQVLKAGDVLVSMTRPNLNAVAVVPADLDGSIGSTGFHVLRGKEAESGFLFYAVQTPGFVDAMCQKVQGALYPAVRPRDISSFCLPPFSLGAQKKIIAAIETQFARLEAGVAALRRVQANLKRYRAAVLKAACEGRLVPTEAEQKRTTDDTDGTDKRVLKSVSSVKSVVKNPGYETGAELLARILTERRQNWQGRGKYKEPSAPDTSSLPLLPDGWTWASLDQLLGLLRNGISAKPDAESGLPMLRISAVRALSVNLAEARFLNAEASDYPDYALTEGDLLFTRYNGNPELVGVCGVVPPLTAPLVHPDKLIRCKLVATGALPDFVAIMANVGASRNYLAKRVRTTAGQAGISGGDLKGLPIPVAPLAEQTRIVAEVERRLSVVDELESVVRANLQRATRLRQSILQKAFTGELIFEENSA